MIKIVHMFLTTKIIHKDTFFIFENSDFQLEKNK